MMLEAHEGVLILISHIGTDQVVPISTMYIFRDQVCSFLILCDVERSYGREIVFGAGGGNWC